jgi:hypothetical protein
MNDDGKGNEKTPAKMLGGVTGKGFMPGQSGNPSGRPSKRRLTDCYEALIEQPLPEDLRVGMKLPEGAIWGDAIAMGQARAAIKGKTDAAREIGDRLEGKARQPVEVSGRNGAPVNLAEIIATVRRRKAALAAEERRQEANAGKTERGRW